MTWLRDLCRRLWPLVDWRRAAVLEARHRGAAAMLDESMRRTVVVLDFDAEPFTAAMRNVNETLRSGPLDPYRLGDSDGTWSREVGDVPRNVEPTDGEAAEPRTITVDRDVLMRRAREASEGGADYLPPWTGEGL